MKHIKEKYAGKTFAQVAEEINRKYKNRNVDLTQKKSYETEIAELIKMNESAKALAQAQDRVKEILKCGGKVKAAFGLNLGDPLKPAVPPGNTGWIAQQQNPGPIYSENPIQNIGLSLPDFYTPTGDPSLGPVGFPKRDKLTVEPLPVTNHPKTSIPSHEELVSQMKKSSDTSLSNKKPGILERLFGKESNIYNPAFAGQAVNLGINAAILAGGYDKEMPQNNKYESDIRRLMQERGIDNTAIQNRINFQTAAGRQNLQNVRSANVRNALEQNLFSSSMEQSSNAELQAQQMRNAYTGEYANILNNLGIQDAQARVLANELTARNKGNWQSMLSQFGQNIAENSKFFTRLKANDRMNKLYTEIINQSSDDFGISENLMSKLKSGKPLSAKDIVELKQSGNKKLIQFADFYNENK